MSSVAPEKLPLQKIYRWERERAHHVYMTQPMGGGESGEEAERGTGAGCFWGVHGLGWES